MIEQSKPGRVWSFRAADSWIAEDWGWLKVWYLCVLGSIVKGVTVVEVGKKIVIAGMGGKERERDGEISNESP